MSSGVANSGIEGDQFGAHLHVRDPDNVAIECFAAAPPR
jgi:hypothetical protein